MFAGADWQPTKIERVVRVLDTSTKPFIAVTDEGTAVIKYLGNAAGPDALICELVGSEIAKLMGLNTPDFAIASIPELALPNHPFANVSAGPAFFSRWEEATPLSPNSSLLDKLRHPDHISKLVVLDTLLRNKDRFSDPASGYRVINYDNILLKQDKRMVDLLVIDHSHAFADTTLEDELDQEWVEEEEVYGLFQQFEPFLTHETLAAALATLDVIDLATVRDICGGVPAEWGMTASLRDRISSCVAERGQLLGNWLPAAIFGQYEMQLNNGGAHHE